MSAMGSVRVFCSCSDAKFAQLRACYCEDTHWRRRCDRCGRDWQYTHARWHAAFVDATTSRDREVRLPL